MADDTEDDAPAAQAGEESRLEELGDFIRNQREGARLSLRKLARIAGVSNPYLSQIERGLRKPSAEILQAIAKSLHISAETLYVKAGILEERHGEVDVESAINRDGRLTEAQRQALIETYRSFRRVNEPPGAASPEAGEQPRPADRLRGLLGGAMPGDVDDDAIRRAQPAEEDVDEA